MPFTNKFYLDKKKKKGVYIYIYYNMWREVQFSLKGVVQNKQRLKNLKVPKKKKKKGVPFPDWNSSTLSSAA